MKQIYYFTFYLFLLPLSQAFGAQSDQIKLKDVQVLTLKANRMTTGRRTAPVPQLKCVGNCPYNLPQVVQCTNKGWDGTNVQWECKAEMDKGYRFGDLAVICEGYNYPDDPYILAGSCGLEYTLTSDSSNQYGKSQQSYGWQEDLLSKKGKSGSTLQDLVMLVAVAGIIYVLYKTCIAGRNEDPTTARSTTNDDFPPDDRQTPNMGWNIPGMGRTHGMGAGAGAGSGYASCGDPGRARGAGAGAAGGGFWTGMATGGLLGYMFGNRNPGYQQQGQYYGRRAPSSGFFSQSQPSYSSSYSSSPSSSSTRTSTGFAETRRR